MADGANFEFDQYTKFELQQYRALRAEVVQTMQGSNQIMAFGFAAVGLTVNAGVAEVGAQLSFFVFSLVLPVLSTLIFSFWFAAEERTARASYFMSGIEARIKNMSAAPEELNWCRVDLYYPSWESWLRRLRAKGELLNQGLP